MDQTVLDSQCKKQPAIAGKIEEWTEDMSELQNFLYALSTGYSWVLMFLAVLTVALITYYCAQHSGRATWRAISLCAEVFSLVGLVSLGSVLCNHYFDERAENTESKIAVLKRNLLDQQGLLVAACRKVEALPRVTPELVDPHNLCKAVEHFVSPYSKDFSLNDQIQLTRVALQQFGPIKSWSETLSDLLNTLTELERNVGDLPQTQYERELVRKGMSWNMLCVLLLSALLAIGFKTARAFKEWKDSQSKT